MRLQTAAALAMAAVRVQAAFEVLAVGPGQPASIPSWDLQSSSAVSTDIAALSNPGMDVSSWYHTPSSRCTLMGCLLDAGIYSDAHLWFSENLNEFNWGQFTVPWLYRHEFALAPVVSGDWNTSGTRHYILKTNGITSKADLFLNGLQIADKEKQAGASGGHTYDITEVVVDSNKRNALIVCVYPTDYNYDFAEGFIDWNPYPPDNGTGVWRNVTISQTGPISMGPLAVLTEMTLTSSDGYSSYENAKVTLRAMLQNMEKHNVTTTAEAVVGEPYGGPENRWHQTVRLGPLETRQVTLERELQQARIWWPRQWGEQPMYTARLSCLVNGMISDTGTENFGIRSVTSEVNAHNDTIFAVNGQPFQVLGAAYNPDMFLRWDSSRFTQIAQYALDLGFNTIRLEGKFEHPEMYGILDQLGLMVLPGWECCDKWEAWSYNDELSVSPVPIWSEADYAIANASIRQEAATLQTHPSVLAYLVGSDFWPNDRATAIYVDALHAAGWQIPIVCSAAKRGYPELLGPSGMKMDGPYDWVPPNYWYDTEPSEDRLGAAFGFGSELGAGVGTPEHASLARFLTREDMDDLWRAPNKNLFHMSSNTSSFYSRGIYNNALWARHGPPASLTDYLLKAQMMDYEATRAQFEAYSSQWNAARPATGAIYWMLNSAWPNLHWSLFDFYMHPAGAFFGAKTATRIEHVAFDYISRRVWLINRSLTLKGPRTVEVDVIDLSGRVLSSQHISADTVPNTSRKIGDIEGLDNLAAGDVALLRLRLYAEAGLGATMLSRNVYWASRSVDKLDWANSSWFDTSVTQFVNYTAISSMNTADLRVNVIPAIGDSGSKSVVLENHSAAPALFIRLNLVDEMGSDVNPVVWSDNYVSLWLFEILVLTLRDGTDSGTAVEVSGVNVVDTLIKF